MGANGQYFMDEVYFCVAPNRAGNILDFNVASIEADTSGWFVTNGTLSRTNGFLASGTGYYCLGGTSTDVGEMVLRTAVGVPVTEGVEYVAYAAVQSPTAALSTRFNISWYDSVGTRVAVSERTLTIDNNIQRVAVVGVCPATAVTARIWFRPVATAASQVFAADDVSLAVAPNKAGNKLTFQEFSTEDSDIPAWTVDGGAAAERTYLTSSISDGFYSLSYVPSERRINRLSLDRLVPVTPGITYAVGAVYFGSNKSGQPTTMSYRVTVDWYDASGVLFQADNPDGFYSVDIANNAINGSASTETRTAPVGAAFARLVIELDHTYSLVERYYVDNVSLIESSPEYELSSSNETGSVTFKMNYTYPTATAVTIQRLDEDGTASPMRGYGSEYDKAPYTPVPMLIEDYEAPLGSRVMYAVTWWKADGSRASRLFTQAIAAPVLEDPDYVWFKSPGIPALNTTLMMEAPIKWSREARQALYQIVGRRNPIAITDARPGRKASLSLLVWDEASNALFDSLLDTGLTALIQAMPGYGVDGNLYLSIGAVDVESVTNAANIPGWRWTLEVSVVDRPSGGLQGSASGTWQTVSDHNVDWADVFNKNEVWSDVLTNP
jgi:uncharacterized protein YcfL